MRSTELLLLITAVVSALGCGHYENRDFFARGRGIGITDPEPDKDGTWWLGIEHETARPQSGQLVQRWDASVSSNTIAVHAWVVAAGGFNRWWYGMPESGAHIETIHEGQYRVVYRDTDGQEWLLGSVEARRLEIVPPQRWQWSSVERHNHGVHPTPTALFSGVSGAAPSGYPFLPARCNTAMIGHGDGPGGPW
jgi:hypothetical protein